MHEKLDSPQWHSAVSMKSNVQSVHPIEILIAFDAKKSNMIC